MKAPGSREPIGHLAATRPVALRVLLRHGIDIGWQGTESLARACARRGLDPAGVLREIAAEEARGALDCVRWEARPLPELLDFLVLRYHRPLRQALPELERLAQRVLRVHGPEDGERLAQVHQAVLTLREELELHMAKEEVELFPWLRAGRGASAGELLREADGEHAVVGACLARLRQLTGDYQVPPQAELDQYELWMALQLVESELREHMHLENDILFLRARSC